MAVIELIKFLFHANVQFCMSNKMSDRIHLYGGKSTNWSEISVASLLQRP